MPAKEQNALERMHQGTMRMGTTSSETLLQKVLEKKLKHYFWLFSNAECFQI